jgi:hypothetical protein
MSRFVDAIIVYRILRKLATPFEETDAFKMGIIDAKGKILRKFTSLKDDKEKDAYTLLDRLVWRIKRIIERVPFESRKVASFAAALALVKESLAANAEPVDLELQLMQRIRQDLSEEMVLVEEFFNQPQVKSFRMFVEDGMAVGGGFSGQATPNPNPNLAGRDIGLGKLQKRKKPNV